jgi:predicted GNAT family acetyltransferase
MKSLTIEQLDNPIWNALTTRHAEMAEGGELARRYPQAFTSLAGLREPSDEAYAELAQITKVQQHVALFSLADPPTPPLFECRTKSPAAQMICNKLIDCKTHPMQILTKADVPEMTALARLTQPGPFSDRTIEFGVFLGIKDGSKLVAMAGERMKLPGYDEVSAVCTHPDYQGRGYARALVHAVAERIIERGSIPMLHVKADNIAGIRTYQSIGFDIRRQFYFSLLRRLSLL